VAAPDPLGLQPRPFAVVRCAACGLAYTHPRPDTASLGRYYEDIYSGRGGDAMNSAQTSQGMWYVHEVRWKLLRRHLHLGSEDRVLDVGCGYGAFLAFLHGRARCRIHGIDTDAGSIRDNLCRSHGDLRVGDLAHAGYPAGHFAFASMLHSLEHTEDPVATLRELRRVVRPGGHVLVEVPNFRSVLRGLFGKSWFPLMLPQHLTHFEPTTLRRALQQVGLTRVLVLRSSWCPSELTMSVAPLLGRLLGVDPASGSGLRARIAGLALVLLFVFLDLPLSVLLVLLGRSGCLVALAEVPETPQGRGAPAAHGVRP
jgi:SAM-dependent methyltransferase